MPKVKAGDGPARSMQQSSVPSNMGGMSIIISKRGGDEELARLQLPGFCVDHMMMASPEANVSMMLKHINSVLKPNTVTALYFEGEPCSGITAEDCTDGMVFEVDC
ncbi:hypothetical protein Pmar_PMAR016213 [Perkinsus marinus ATCC 50983]|uniref:Uncharacterized protein n=1 Tax=Perkinsus marinus (strain ATCC 50983 / TXsc) TaxID=423536 RepID=C5KIU7_PERM5|nr:hypothetical protein Pmar_PMAR016213 [Perkinsus marinus ATCC 50983]EER15583.1 hypothetical protein Pmar_PMAR016213 [Perkinsus marinus ATCC 50983]|eukprot:XP_002783787.1 hypothetical protein Pmar_PMAR016213 [Perkinsus marinus ATCC 50983]